MRTNKLATAAVLFEITRIEQLYCERRIFEDIQNEFGRGDRHVRCFVLAIFHAFVYVNEVVFDHLFAAIVP